MAWGQSLGAVSSGRNRLLSGQNDTVRIPPALTRRYPILYMPPGLELAWAGIDPVTSPGANLLLSSLCAGGALVLTADWDVGSGFYGSSWGVPQTRTNVETVRRLIPSLAASLGVPNAQILDNSKIVLVGGSQGACDCYGYAMDNPDKVQAIGTWAGVTDLIGFYSGVYRWGGNAGTGNQPAISACWGITPPAPLPANADPYNNASRIKCPVYISYSDGDATIPTASALAMAAALPAGEAHRNSLTDPHADVEAGDAAVTGLAAWVLRQAT